ncbi:hypothetical protein pb186bvf_018095 [Paramecium bursaria]
MCLQKKKNFSLVRQRIFILQNFYSRLKNFFIYIVFLQDTFFKK